MATLEKIRSKAGCLILIIAFALLCFIVGDFLTNSTSLFNRKANVIGEVNGVELSNQDFDESYQELSTVVKLRPQSNYDDATLRSAVFENFKQRVLLESEAEADGLAVTSAELTDVTVGDHTYPLLYNLGFFTNQQGMFDKNVVTAIINDVNKDPNSITDADQRAEFQKRQETERNVWFYVEKTVKQSLLSDKISSILTNAMSAPKAETDYLASISSKESDALVARKLYADVNDADVKVTDDDLKAYYDKNKEYQFKGEDYRNMQVIVFPIEPSLKDLANAKADMDSLRSQLAKTNDKEKLRLIFESSSEQGFPFYDAYAKPDRYDRSFVEFAKTASAGQVSEVVVDQEQSLLKVAKAVGAPANRPDSVNFSYIVLQAADSVAAQKRADSAAAALRGGADFAQLAASISKDPNGAQAKWAQEGQVGLPGFDDKAFGGKAGNVFTVVNNQVAFVFKVNEVTKPVLKAKISILAKRLEASSETADSLLNFANNYVDTYKDSKSFIENASKQNLMIRPLNNLRRNQPSTYVMQNSRSVIKWAYDEDRKEGDVTAEVITDVPGFYVIGALTDIVNMDGGVAPFDKVKDQIKPIVTRDKKAEKLMAEMNGKQLAQIGAVDSAKAVRFPSNFVANIGSEPALVGAITAAKVNTLSKPIKGNMGVFMFQKVAERPSSLPGFDAATINRGIQSSVYRSMFDAMEDKADVNDYSYNFF